jgi:hypothetical protein
VTLLLLVTEPEEVELVTLADVRQHLKNQVSGVHDDELRRAIRTARPLIENIVGPVVAQTITEWHDGGAAAIQVRRRPSTALGTSPILTLLACTEYVGATAYELALVADPSRGSTYSVMIDPIGTITRRTAGGGVGVFAGGPRSVKVVYVAGQSRVPANVYDAALELIRGAYQNTQPVGNGRRTVADELDAPQMRMSPYVERMLAPNRRHPSIA